MKIENINRKFRQLAVWILRHRLLVMGLFALLWKSHTNLTHPGKVF